DLLKEGALGAFLTGLMVLLFLRDWRSAFIVVVNIPLSLLASCLALWMTGQSIHLMTLGGLALAVGILVDEATVAVENIHSHLARGESLAGAALLGTRETTLPRFLAMVCVLAVFIPAFFMIGAAKALFVPLALAVGFSMIASFFLSSTLVPILSVWLLRGKGGANHENGREDSGLLRSLLSPFMKASIAARWVVVPAYLGGIAAILLLIGPFVGREIFPQTDSGQFALRFRAPSGTQVGITEKIATRILDVVAKEVGGNEKIAISIGMVGVHNSSFPVNLVHLWNGGPGEGFLAVQLKEDAGVRIAPLKERLREVLGQEMPDVKLSFEPQDIVSRVMSFGSPTPIEVAVSTGGDLATSKAHAEKLLDALRKIPSLRDVQIAQDLEFPTVNVRIDRERAGFLGVDVEDIARSLVAATTSSRFTVPNFWADPKTGISFNIQVQIPEERTRSLEDLRNTPVASRNGTPVLLRNLVDITEGTSVGTYERYNLARVVSITANLHGTDFGRAIRAVEKAIASVGPPADAKTKVDLRGQVVPYRQLSEGFGTGLVIAMVAIFLLLCANFQSVRLALVVISTLPAVLAGITLSLWVTGTTVNIQSGIGAIMAVGVAVANAILLVTFSENARRRNASGSEANPAAAAYEGARSRVRAVVMTSCAMIAGMMPLALGLGEGGDQTAPLGRAVVGGLVFATLATLLILPAFYALLAGKRVKSPSLDPEDPESRHFGQLAPVTES
ncbi:MAG: efflux RND transporter permease subunit, partial [Verrucomicrobiae bacterium]|nr:efflux RND transporter permease subunit [Verrucomicrobiae bacterium]